MNFCFCKIVCLGREREKIELYTISKSGVYCTKDYINEIGNFSHKQNTARDGHALCDIAKVGGC